MKIAIAQFDARLGDIESICSRIREQSQLAISQGAKLLCVPAPLMCGVAPGLLIENGNFEHDMMRALQNLARAFSDDDFSILVPAIVSLDGSPLFDVIMLKEGRVVPSRLFCMHQRRGLGQDLWAPPIFEIGGLRIAVSFDAQRDISSLPQGCDVLIFFQANGFNQNDFTTVGFAGLLEGSFIDEVRSRGIWLAGVCPIGGFDESVFTGGSFFLDESGRLISHAPSFEEALLVQDVVRGTQLPEVALTDELRFNKQEWLWNALQIHLRDSLEPYGSRKVVVELDGGLASSLLAMLAVDAVGSRNVVSVLVERCDSVTPEQVHAESSRRRMVRDLASGLHIRLVERSARVLTDIFDRDASRFDAVRSAQLAASVILEDLAEEYGASILSPLTKSDYSLPGHHVDRYRFAVLAPFGDVYLSDLEFVARYRNRVSPVIPQGIVSLHEVETAMSRILYDAVSTHISDGSRVSQAGKLFRDLDASQVDDVFKGAIDGGMVFEDIPLSRFSADAVVLLLLLMRAGEGARRRMAPYPIVSSRSYYERSWPQQLAWSDAGRDGQEALSFDGCARDEVERFAKRGEQLGETMREEVAEFIGGLLGLNPDQLRSMMEEGHGEIQGDMDKLEEAARNAMGSLEGRPSHEPGEGGRIGPSPLSGMRPSDFPFFSIN